MDTDGNRVVGRYEFERAMARMRRGGGGAAGMAEMAFNRMDADGNGVVGPLEFERAHMARFDRMDANRDGAISRAEFARHMERLMEHRGY